MTANLILVVTKILSPCTFGCFTWVPFCSQQLLFCNWLFPFIKTTLAPFNIYTISFCVAYWLLYPTTVIQRASTILFIILKQHFNKKSNERVNNIGIIVDCFADQWSVSPSCSSLSHSPCALVLCSSNSSSFSAAYTNDIEILCQEVVTLAVMETLWVAQLELALHWP